MSKKFMIFVFAIAATVGASFSAHAAAGDPLASRVQESLGSYGKSVAVRADSEGRVFLSGAVGTESEKKVAVSLAEKTPGVKIVHENIEALSGGSQG